MVEKWNIQRVWTGEAKPWRAFAPAPSCLEEFGCRCRSFPSQAEAFAYALAEARAVDAVGPVALEVTA
ncbi:hypothetical protein SEA_BLUEFEATHER_24 [Arthrobacter phage BlueFeather]|uniref:Uncharacterized protein n=1 Tax=Arthrobacter phage BlueFeather TaxID=2713258 RepID=A0A6G8R2Z4_9CAUD|nr:hypothetical protein QEX68_gp24 [Arthrobacter phage BlueFeather]QIN94328.1 hypothetical protein SEA_BLUEFEATHER_24 [Arthrobacter phage BlueFeather]